jgi:hypothetical protein
LAISLRRMRWRRGNERARKQEPLVRKRQVRDSRRKVTAHSGVRHTRAMLPTRVIFDRSAFHGERFDTLISSPLRGLVRCGRVKVFLTPVFIHETLHPFGSGRTGNDWREHLQYAVEICNGGVFLDKSEIFRNELLCGQGTAAQHIFPQRRTRRYGPSNTDVLDQLRLIANADDGELAQPWKEGEAQRDDIQRKKDAQKAYYSKVRQDIGDALRRGYVRSSLQDHLNVDFLPAGRHFMKVVDKGRQLVLAEMWARDPWRYPFYSAFIEGLVYTVYHAAEEHNAKIDRNSQADFEQLAFLTWADVIVSDDNKFFRQAFDALWKPRGKRNLTAEEFSDFANAIQR